MIVVSDTSPITNLIQIGLLEILEKVYGKIIIPSVVYSELCHIELQKEILDKNKWIEVQTPQDQKLIKSLEIDLDKGESESIALAFEVHADFLLIDEAKGRLKAQELGIKIVGILGTLIKAKQLGYISDVKTHLQSLRDVAGFYINPKLLAHVLNLADES